MSASVWPVTCAQCGEVSFKPVGAVNRANKLGANLYCNRACAGLGRRDPNPPSAAEKQAAKAEYDRKRRAELGEVLLAEKRAARQALLASNPELVRQREKRNRDLSKDRHAEYCRTPEYRKWKAQYDRQHLARKAYGPFAEAALTLRDLEAEVSSRATRTEIYAANGTLNKWTQRRRDYERQTDRR